MRSFADDGADPACAPDEARENTEAVRALLDRYIRATFRAGLHYGIAAVAPFVSVSGVVAALEVAQALAEDGDTLRHPLAVVDFLSEEPSDYGVSCVGSRAMVGTLTPDMLTATNLQGETLAAAIWSRTA